MVERWMVERWMERRWMVEGRGEWEDEVRENEQKGKIK